MHYERKDLGLSFDLPDGWRYDEGNLAAVTFYGPNGGIGCTSELIQMRIGTIKPQYFDPDNRAKSLAEPGADVLMGKLGDETNVVVMRKANDCEISGVRDGIQYVICHFNDAATEQAIERLKESVKFPSREQAAKAIQKMSEAGPAGQAFHKALMARSPEEAREALSDAGMPGTRIHGGTFHSVPQHKIKFGSVTNGEVTDPRVSELEKLLDNPTQGVKAEDELAALGEQAVDPLLGAVDRINGLLLKRESPESNMKALERRVRVLGRIGNPRAAKALIAAVADSAGTVEVLQQQIISQPEMALLAFPRQEVARSLRDAAVAALVAVGEPALPVIQSSIPRGSRPAQKALRRAASKIQKTWWQFWR